MLKGVGIACARSINHNFSPNEKLRVMIRFAVNLCEL